MIIATIISDTAVIIQFFNHYLSQQFIANTKNYLIDIEHQLLS